MKLKDEIISEKTNTLARKKGFDFGKQPQTQTLLQRWLREKHEILVQPFSDESEWKVAILDYHENMLGDYEQDENMSYEQALEIGLFAGLKLI